MLVASAQHFVSDVSDELIEQFIVEFEQHLSETGAHGTKPQNFFTVFYVAEYKDKDYDMELWMQVEGPRENTSYIQFKVIAENEIASILVSENYENLKFAYDALYDYVLKQGYAVNGYPRETYSFDDNSSCGYFTGIQLPFIRKKT